MKLTLSWLKRHLETEASAAETLDTYSHLWPDSDDRTRVAVDSVLGRVADSVRTDASV